jgi:hypothetical protein
MRRPWRSVLVVVLVVVVGTGPSSRASGVGGAGCAPFGADDSYARRVDVALRARADMWGNELLRTSAGPTYAAARRFLRPLLMARGPHGRFLTPSGFHYVAFAQPGRADGSETAALHVADGSQILSKRADGRSLTIRVGRDGRERFGSCLARLALPQLAQGYLPILETRYVDEQGVRYHQESFVARSLDEEALRSFVRVDADASRARGDTLIRFTADGEAPATISVPSRLRASAFVAWPLVSTNEAPQVIDRATFETARASVVQFWTRRLSEGTTIDVPELRVRNALRNLVLQNLVLGWRYSIGNPYDEFSYPEALDVAQVMDDYGFPDVGAAILRRSLTTPRGPFPNWRIGQKLVAAASHYRRFRDRDVLDELTPPLGRDVGTLARQLVGGPGLLHRERYSSDIPDLVYGLHSQAVVWQGLRDMGSVWASTGHEALAEGCRRTAARLGNGLRRAVRASSRRLRDGSLFVPVRLLGDERPYESVTESRSGSYWNLVAPYALASGLFNPGALETRGVLDYLFAHGTRMLGVPRAGAFSLYGRRPVPPASGVNPVYGLNMARFLADNDRPDQLVLSLYGQLAIGMSPGTFVSGEAGSVAPLRGVGYRSMYLPPNGASNASFLETARLMLVHETRDRRGAPRGLQLAYATPRAWLEPGHRIEVRNAPTSFGPLSYEITSSANATRVAVDVPDRRSPTTLTVRLRLPRGSSILRAFVGARSLRIGRDGETLNLSGSSGHVDVVADVER